MIIILKYTIYIKTIIYRIVIKNMIINNSFNNKYKIIIIRKTILKGL